MTTADARVLAIADAFIDDELEYSPDHVAHLRPPGARYDTLPDESSGGLAKRRTKLDRMREELTRIPLRDLKSESAKLAWQVTNEALETERAARVCREELFAVSQVGGWQVRFADLAEAQPVGTPEYREQALRRFRLIPAYVDAQIVNLREGLKLGYVAAAVNVAQVIEQLDSLLGAPPKESPFYSPAERDGDAAFQKAFETLVNEDLRSALTRYRDFLAKDYRPLARKNVAIAGNPEGSACYAALLRAHTTLPLDAKEVHETGRRQIAAIEEEMMALSKKSQGGVDVKTLLTRFRDDPRYRFADKKAVIDQAESAVARGRAVVSKVTTIVPKGNVAVEPIPAFQEKTSPAHYLSAALDGTRAAAYRIRLYEPTKQSRVPGESVAFHETIPGHHLQVAIANERTENPRVCRFHWVSAYGEGWALYAERLADELGLFSSDEARFGMLNSAAFRATRLVVDTGLHAMGWSRQRAIDELLAHTAMSKGAASAEVDRYISWPGQATSYMTGYLEIRALRTEAERELGPKFDLRAFHDTVLASGSVPLPVLRERVRAYIAAAARKNG